MSLECLCLLNGIDNFEGEQVMTKKLPRQLIEKILIVYNQIFNIVH